MFDHGRGVRQNIPEAKRWYGLAFEQGHSGAEVNLAILNGYDARGDDDDELRKNAGGGDDDEYYNEDAGFLANAENIAAAAQLPMPPARVPQFVSSEEPTPAMAQDRWFSRLKGAVASILGAPAAAATSGPSPRSAGRNGGSRRAANRRFGEQRREVAVPRGALPGSY